MKSVFLGIPQFTKYVNVEIVWDLINVLREFINYELEPDTRVNNKNNDKKLQNVIAALLCAFQIIQVGAGTTFAVEEKDFIDGLYTVIQLMM